MPEIRRWTKPSRSCDVRSVYRKAQTTASSASMTIRAKMRAIGTIHHIKISVECLPAPIRKTVRGWAGIRFTFIASFCIGIGMLWVQKDPRLLRLKELTQLSNNRRRNADHCLIAEIICQGNQTKTVSDYNLAIGLSEECGEKVVFRCLAMQHATRTATSRGILGVWLNKNQSG